MELFQIQSLVDIIVKYVSCDIQCDDILKMNWSQYVISSLQVSYLSHIINEYPNKIDIHVLALNPMLTPDLIAMMDIVPAFNIDHPIGDILRRFRRFRRFRRTRKELSYQYIKDHKHELGWKAIAEHPSSGDLLLEVLKYANSRVRELAFNNPSFPFDKIDMRKTLSDTCKRGSIFYICEYHLLSNRNLPLDLVRKYGYRDNKLDPLVYEHHHDIDRIFKEYPPTSDNHKALLNNIAYYLYCIERILHQYLPRM